jgi:ribonuclease J
VAPPVHLTFLGGLGEIGRNCAALELDDQIVLIDCGLMFPDADMLGIDLVLPDFTWLRENKDRIIGCVLTHGHEDHTGGLSFLLREVKFPLYGSELTLGLARHRIDEAGLTGRTEFIPVADGEERAIGPFDVEFIPVTHSVPHGFATAFHTPQGTILHSGDFKIDLTPVDGRLTDLARIGALADGDGIRLLLADSTNADERGHSRSERSVGAVLYDLFHAHEGRRIITACFASHIHRVQQIVDSAVSFDRKVAFVGQSMHKNVALARGLGLLKVPDNRIVDIEDIDDYDPSRVCVICTGSQGEPMSALALMASSENRWIKVGPDDTVIMSSHPIPGNEFPVNRVIDSLTRLGVTVIHSDLEDVHATGHAKQEELKLFHGIAQPDWFIPVHGEYRHMIAHAKLAVEMGLPEEYALVCEDGDRLALTDDGLVREDPVPAGYLYVDGTVGDVGHGVLRDRRVLAKEGVVVVIVGVDLATGELLSGPEIVTRGWVHHDEAVDLLDEAAAEVRKEIESVLREPPVDHDKLQRQVRRATGRFVADRTRRRPMIVPVVMEA